MWCWKLSRVWFEMLAKTLKFIRTIKKRKAFKVEVSFRKNTSKPFWLKFVCVISWINLFFFSFPFITKCAPKILKFGEVQIAKVLFNLGYSFIQIPMNPDFELNCNSVHMKLDFISFWCYEIVLQTRLKKSWNVMKHRAVISLNVIIVQFIPSLM